MFVNNESGLLDKAFMDNHLDEMRKIEQNLSQTTTRILRFELTPEEYKKWRLVHNTE